VAIGYLALLDLEVVVECKACRHVVDILVKHFPPFIEEWPKFGLVVQKLVG
jgi:hypothetical protein